MNLYYWGAFIAFGAGMFCSGVIAGRIMLIHKISTVWKIKHIESQTLI